MATNIVLLLGFPLLSDFQITKTKTVSVSQLIIMKLWLLTGDNIPDFHTMSDEFNLN